MYWFYATLGWTLAVEVSLLDRLALIMVVAGHDLFRTDGAIYGSHVVLNIRVIAINGFLPNIYHPLSPFRAAMSRS